MVERQDQIIPARILNEQKAGVKMKKKIVRLPATAAAITVLAIAAFACSESVNVSSPPDTQAAQFSPTTTYVWEPPMNPTAAYEERVKIVGTLSSDEVLQNNLETELPEGFQDAIFKLVMTDGESRDSSVCGGILVDWGLVQTIDLYNNITNWFIGEMGTAKHCSEAYGASIEEDDYLNIMSLNESRNGIASQDVIPLFYENGDSTSIGAYKKSKLIFAVDISNITNRQWKTVGAGAFDVGTDLIGQRVIIAGVPAGSNGQLTLTEGTVVDYKDNRMLIDAPGINYGSSGGPIMIPGSGINVGMTEEMDALNTTKMFGTYNTGDVRTWFGNSQWKDKAQTMLQEMVNASGQ